MCRIGGGVILSACAIAALIYAEGHIKPVGSNLELPAETRTIALTFDDGPRAETTEALLEGLAARDAKATFFVVGEQIAGNEALIARMAEDGHQIGSHTYSHIAIEGTSDETVLQEISKNEVLLEHIVGAREFWLRPPYGLIEKEQQALVETPMVYWSIDPEDWKYRDTAHIAEHVCSRAKDGDIVLLHDFYPTSVAAALEIVDRLQAEGYRFVTVEELLRLHGTQPQAGRLYIDAKSYR